LWFARKEVGEIRQRPEHDLRKLDDRRHGHFLPKQSAPSKTTAIKAEKNQSFQRRMSYPQQLVHQAMLAKQELVPQLAIEGT
jgi:hypothetical protein